MVQNLSTLLVDIKVIDSVTPFYKAYSNLADILVFLGYQKSTK